MLGMTAVGALVLMYLMYQPRPDATAADDDDSEPPPPPRNFTIEQLHVSTTTGGGLCLVLVFLPRRLGLSLLRSKVHCGQQRLVVRFPLAGAGFARVSKVRA